MQEVCEAEQLTSRGMVIEMQHPTAGTVKNIDSPLRFDDQDNDQHEPPPLSGQHTTEVLRTLLGIPSDQVAELAARGVVRCQEVREVQG